MGRMTGGADLMDTDVFTLLGVRRDGVASVVDLVADGPGHARNRAEAMLNEHGSCEAVEVWQGGALVEKIVRA
jgi:hypothetical protein